MMHSMLVRTTISKMSYLVENQGLTPPFNLSSSTVTKQALKIKVKFKYIADLWLSRGEKSIKIKVTILAST